MSRLELLDNENKKRPDNGRDFYFEEKDDKGNVVNIFDNKEKYIQYLSDFLRAEFDRKDDEKAEQEQVIEPTEQTKAEIQWFKNRPTYDRALASMNQAMPEMKETDREWFKNRVSNDKQVDSDQIQEVVQPKLAVDVKRCSAIVEGQVNYKVAPEKAQTNVIFAEAYDGYKKANEKIVKDNVVKKSSWLSKAWAQLNKPFSGLKQAAREFGNALYVPEQVNVYKFMQVLNDRFAGQIDQYDAAMQVAVIDKFVKENRLNLTENSYNELIVRKQILVNGLRENKYAKILSADDKSDYATKKARLADLKLLADVNVNATRDQNGKALLEVNFGDNVRLANYSESLMKSGLDEIMAELRDKKLEYRGRQVKKALATAGLMIGLMFMPHGVSRSVEQKSIKPKVADKKTNVSYSKDFQPIKFIKDSVQLDAAEQELANLVSWDSVKEIAVENGIYLDSDVKEFMTVQFAGEMTHEKNRNLVLNHTNLIPGNYKTFAEFKAVCAFYDSHIDFFKGHPENVNLVTKYPELMYQANDIESLTVAAVDYLGLKQYCLEMGIDYKLLKEAVQFHKDELGQDLLKDGKKFRAIANNLKTLEKSTEVVYGDSNYEPIKNYVEPEVQEPSNVISNIENSFNNSDYSEMSETVNQVITDSNTDNNSNESLVVKEQGDHDYELCPDPVERDYDLVPDDVAYKDGGTVDETPSAEYVDGEIITGTVLNQVGFENSAIEEDVEVGVTRPNIVSENENRGDSSAMVRPTLDSGDNNDQKEQLEEEYKNSNFILEKTLEEEAEEETTRPVLPSDNQWEELDDNYDII